MDPPYIKWKQKHIYACFLSHYKMESASDARYMHDMLRKMLRTPVFLDSSALSDLRELITQGVHKSDTLVLLATKSVLTRPWCLLELLETARKKVPVIMVVMANGGFTFESARFFAVHLEREMARLNPAGLELLHQRIGTDLRELQQAVLQVLDENERRPVTFNSHVGDNTMVATMKDVVEKMALATGQKAQWIDVQGSKLRRGHSKKAAKYARFRISKEAIESIYHTISQRSSQRRTSVMSKSCQVHNKESDIFICCCREDALSHARVLRSFLSIRLGRGCAIGGSSDTSSHVASSLLVVILLTNKLIYCPSALFEAWLSLRRGLPIVTLAITGVGYDFSEASAAFANLPAALERSAPNKAAELQALLPPDVTVAQVGELLYTCLTSIIATSWSPAASVNQVHAIVDGIIARMPKRRMTSMHTKFPSSLHKLSLSSREASPRSTQRTVSSRTHSPGSSTKLRLRWRTSSVRSPSPEVPLSC
ncbi:hypothetical protein AB1Y20_015637 [Prymnesium parvum]|uniref:TIR domain-containing protein n=1 Tax=Prymnesium parvum TaxID=97485 RepID=A0AB34K142_PRYPA